MPALTSLLPGLVTAALLLLALVRTRDKSGPLMLFVAVFGAFYGLRIILISLGLDTPFPDDLFADRNPSESLNRVVLMFVLFLAAFGIGYAAFFRDDRQIPNLVYVKSPPTLRIQLIVTALLSALGIAVAAYLLNRFGSPADVVEASKQDKRLAGMFALRLPSFIGAMLAAALAVDAWKRKKKLLALGALAVGAGNGLGVLLWGSRSILVVSLLIFLTGIATLERKTLKKTNIPLLVALAGVFVATSFGLRVVRDSTVRGEVLPVVEDASWARKLSISTNATYLDASMLAFEDIPRIYPHRNGEDFLNGILGVVPRVIWEGKPTVIAPGTWFRQRYQPENINGWPVGSPTIWYINFGMLGLLVGGIVSGVAYKWMTCQYRQAARCGFNVAVSITFAAFIAQTGITSQTPLRIFLYGIPMFVVAKVYARPASASAREHRSDTGEPSRASIVNA